MCRKMELGKWEGEGGERREKERRQMAWKRGKEREVYVRRRESW